MSLIDKAIAILERTNDGNALSPGHLGLVQHAANNNLTELGIEAFERLYDEVVSDTYTQPWFHGIEHLRRDHGGTVKWKDIPVEHYTYQDADAEKAAATKLAARCRALEEKGFPVNGRTATDVDLFPAAPADTPWLQAMLRYYTAFADKDGRAKWLVLSIGNGHAAALSVNDSKLETMYMLRSESDSALYLMYHELVRKGFTSCGERLQTYADFVATMAECGIETSHVDHVLATTPW